MDFSKCLGLLQQKWKCSHTCFLQWRFLVSKDICIAALKAFVAFCCCKCFWLCWIKCVLYLISILFAPTKCHYTLGPDLLQPKKSVEKFYLVEVGWFSIECNFMKTSFGGWVSYQKIFLWCLLLRCCAWWYMAKVAGVHDSRWPIYCVAPIRRSHIGCQLSSLKCEQNFWNAKSCNIPTILFRYPFGIPAVGNFLHILELLRTVISPTYSWLWL